MSDISGGPWDRPSGTESIEGGSIEGAPPSLGTRLLGRPETFRHVVDILPVPVVIIDASRRIRFTNSAAQTLFDAPGASFEREPIHSYLSPRKLEAARHVLLSRPGTYSYRDKVSVSGVEIEVLVGSEILTEAGSEEMMLLTIEDRSKERRERLERSASSGAFAPLDSEPPLERLQKAQHLEVLGHLTGTLAHDYGNLLSVIVGSLDAARARLLRGESPALDIERARLAAARSVETTASVLNYFRPRSHRDLGIDPQRVVTELRSLMERALAPRVQLVFELSPCPSLPVEPAQLETAILNLVINASDPQVKAQRVTIGVAEQDLSPAEALEIGLPVGRYARLWVEDDGVGIRQEHLAQVFEPFFTTKSDGRGTGLGLSSVRGFARKQGGEARIESTPGSGTRVSIWLPIG